MEDEVLSMEEHDVKLFQIQELTDDSWCVAQKQQRAHEDRYQAKKIGPMRYYAVFDGHGGPNKMSSDHVGDYCVNHLHEYISAALSTTNLNDIQTVANAITKAFVEFDRKMYTDKLYGTTCTVILIHDEKKRIYQINLGDSRSIIFDAVDIISATDDHEPMGMVEKTRIIKAGGGVFMGRVNGILMISRAFGDFDLKTNNDIIYDPVNGLVSAVPDIKVILMETPMNIIITSDAPYDACAYSDESLVALFRDLETKKCFKSIPSNMISIITPKTTDDITILVVSV